MTNKADAIIKTLMPTATRRKPNAWQTIGEVCVDSGSVIIGDPCNADDACTLWFRLIEDGVTDLNAMMRKDIRAQQVENAVIAQSGLGDGVYKVEARYEDCDQWGKRIAEIRIRFL
jgi:hypothetical protein